MNKDQLAGKWQQLRGEVQRQWGLLSDDQLDRINGDRRKMLGALQETYGYEKEKAEDELKAWEKQSRAA